MRFIRRSTPWLAVLLISRPLAAQDSGVSLRNDSVSIRFVDVDLRAAVHSLGRYLDAPILFGPVTAGRVTLETPHPVARAEVPRLLRSMLDSQQMDLVRDSSAYHVRPRNAPATAGMPVSRPAFAGGPVDLFVIRLRHARAADVAATVNALYGRASALGELGGRPATLTDELRQNRVPPMADPAAGGATGLVGRSASLAGEVTIVPDPHTNSLLIRASANDHALIQAAVEQLDVRPMQVLIEVLIAEIRRDRSLSFGVEASLPTQPLRGTTNTTYDATTAGLGLGDFALHVMRIGGVDLDVTLRAAASRGDVAIVSRPVVLAANNEPAQITVGSQRPFVQVQRALPTDAPIRDQVVQYKDVGTVLNVRPTISADGYVMLEVTQEVNAATTETAFDAPVISTRSVQTRLLIRDGHTAVLGGLADRQRDATQAGVPVLSSIPLIGGLFGRVSRRSTQTELFVFLTPRVIRDDDAMDAATQELRERSRSIERRTRGLRPDPAEDPGAGHPSETPP